MKRLGALWRVPGKLSVLRYHPKLKRKLLRPLEGHHFAAPGFGREECRPAWPAVGGVAAVDELLGLGLRGHHRLRGAEAEHGAQAGGRALF